MRVFTLMLALFAFPALAAAQQAEDGALDTPTPTVQLEESAPADLADMVSTDAAELDATTFQTQSQPTQDAAAQEQGPSSRSWWYLVGAIVVGGIILAVLL